VTSDLIRQYNRKAVQVNVRIAKEKSLKPFDDQIPLKDLRDGSWVPCM